MDNTYTTHTLPNGLRMVHVRTGSPVAWCGLAVNAGSRDDGEGRYGLAHFVEHTIFKGTTHRRSWHIINRMESIGGELNAYTTKEHTMVYSVFPAQHLARAVELIADLVKCSTFPHDEIERERDVVLEEADSYRDTPSDAVYDDVEDILFAGSALGHNILGIEEHLRQLGSEQCMEYLKSLYVPDNMAFFVVGPMAPGRAFRLAEHHLGGMDCPLHRSPREVPVVNAPSRHTVELGLHQAHTVVGARVPGMYSDERFALSLLSNILGGPGMNSRLTARLREKAGLVYTADSYIYMYPDVGVWEVYFGCDKADVNRCLHLVRHELKRFVDERLTPARLKAAKSQFIGQIGIGEANLEGLALTYGKTLAHYDTLHNPALLRERIAALSAAELQAAAAELFAPEQISTLIYD